MTGLDSFVAAALWMMPFVMGRHLRLGASIARRSLLSAAGGISVAYVFVDLLPEMASMQEVFSRASAGSVLPFTQHRVYSSALIGFVGFYALANMIAVSWPGRSTTEDNVPLVAWIHVLGFAFYAAVMGYLLEAETERTLSSLVLYSVAMFCHFWIVDHSLRREHTGFYDDFGRWIIAAAVLAGWTLGMAGFSSDFLLPTLMGFVGGGVVVNSLKVDCTPKMRHKVKGPNTLNGEGYGFGPQSVQPRSEDGGDARD